jgi:multidrug efflux pump subunit AcrB
MALYGPLVDFVLRFRWLTLVLAIVLFGLTWIPFSQLGSEFMPPLNEGTLLYMPTAIPGMSITEATKIIQIQDRILRQFPEVESVFGKAGQADTATDPAPLSMFETVVQLKPPEQWRVGMTWDKLVAQLNDATKTPGMAQIFWMPIQTRTEMLTTGFRSALGIKVFGPDLKGIEDVAVQIERALADLPDTRSAFAERTTRGYFLDFEVDRETAARYGLRVEDVNQIVERAIGGNTIGMTVEGRERYPISVRSVRDFRTDIESLKRTLVSTPAGAQVPISLLAHIAYRTGPPSIREENAQLVGYVFVDITNSDLEGYVRAATAEIQKKVLGKTESSALATARSRALTGSLSFLVLSITIAVAYFFWSSDIANRRARTSGLTMSAASSTQDGVTISMLTSDGRIYAKDNSLTIKFADENGNALNAREVKMDLSMNMPGMVMHSAAKINTGTRPGEYLAHLTPDMAGDWIADVTFQGPQGPTTLVLPINVKQ